jgi:hypothetical protein
MLAPTTSSFASSSLCLRALLPTDYLRLFLSLDFLASRAIRHSGPGALSYLTNRPTDQPLQLWLPRHAASCRSILRVLLPLDYFEALTPLRTLLQPQLPDDLGRRALAQACSFALPRPTSAGASCPETILSSVALGCCPVVTGTDNCVSLRRDNTDINRWVEMVQSLPGDLTAF